MGILVLFLITCCGWGNCAVRIMNLLSSYAIKLGAKYFLSICRHQSYTIFYPFDIVLELKPMLLAERSGIPAGYSVDLPLLKLAVSWADLLGLVTSRGWLVLFTLPAISASDQTNCGHSHGYPLTEELYSELSFGSSYQSDAWYAPCAKPYCWAFATNCSLNMPLQVFFFSFILAYHSKCYHRTRIIEIIMEISGQVKLDLLGGIGVVEDHSSWYWNFEYPSISLQMTEVLDLFLSGASQCVIIYWYLSCIGLCYLLLIE